MSDLDVTPIYAAAITILMAVLSTRVGLLRGKYNIALGDGGVDLRLHRGGALTVVQCKQWRAWKVGAPRVRDLFGAMMHEGAASAVLVTSGRFTRPALEFARGKPIHLIAGDDLARMVSDVSAEPRTTAPPQSGASSFDRATTSQVGDSGPACPRCGTEMVTRVARRGKNAGKQFWGCPGFPKCRGTRQISG